MRCPGAGAAVQGQVHCSGAGLQRGRFPAVPLHQNIPGGRQAWPACSSSRRSPPPPPEPASGAPQPKVVVVVVTWGVGTSDVRCESPYMHLITHENKTRLQYLQWYDHTRGGRIRLFSSLASSARCGTSLMHAHLGSCVQPIEGCCPATRRVSCLFAVTPASGREQERRGLQHTYGRPSAI